MLGELLNKRILGITLLRVMLPVCILLPFTALAQATGGNGIPGLTQVGTFIGSILLNLASAVTWFGGMLLEKSISEFILNIGNILGKNYPLGAVIGQLWGFIRDICNLAFIFGFIYIGIRTIIDADDSGAKRMLASLIIGALLINFSLFITKAVIDVSNYAAVEIYNAVFEGPQDASISAKFAQSIGIMSFYDKNPDPSLLANLTSGGVFAFYFMAAILLIVAGFVFASGAVLLIVRFVALIFIMVFSPILFAATVFPATSGFASKLWGYLFNYSFFAPAYLILLLVSVKIIGATTTAFGGQKSMADAFATGQRDFFGVFLLFSLGIAFLIMSLKVAQQFGVAGADRVMSVGNSLRQRGQKMVGNSTFGLGAATLRATVGRRAYKLADSDGLKDAAAQRGLKGVAARQILKTSRAAADSSMDLRNIGGMKDIGLGEGRKGGYETIKKEIEKKESEFAKSLGEVDDGDVKVEARKKEMQAEEKRLRELEEELRAIGSGAGTEAARKAKREEIEKKKKEIDEAKVKYESEKQRRIIGSTYAKPKASDTQLIEAQKLQIKQIKNTIKNEWETYITLATDAQKEAARDVIQKLKDDLEKAEEEHYSLLNEQSDRGYAGKLEDPSKLRFFTAWPMGRLVRDEREAGKEIRKTAEKGLPKKKDE